MLKGFKKVIRVCSPKRLESNQYQRLAQFNFMFKCNNGRLYFSIKELGYSSLN